MPQLSVNSFAKFIKASPSQQRSILRNSKFPKLKDGKKKPQIVRYSEARAAIRHYHESGNDINELLNAVAALTKKLIEQPAKDKGRINDNIRGIQTYMKYYQNNVFKIMGLPRPKYEHNGIQISATPDLYVEEGEEKKLIKLDFSQRPPDPEVIEILLKVMHEAAQKSDLGVMAKNVVYLDISRQNQFTGAKLNKRLKKEIDATCETIADMWPISKLSESVLREHLVATYSKKLNADFLRVTIPSGENLHDLLKNTHKKGFSKETVVEVGSDYIRLEKLFTWTGELIEGEMARLQMALLPEKGSFESPLESLNLPSNYGTGSVVGFIYDKSLHVLLLEASRAISASGFATYFSELHQLVSGLHLEVIPQPDALKKVLDAPIIKKMHVRLAGPINPGKLMQEDNPAVSEMLKARQELSAPVAEFTYGVQSRSDSLPREGVLAAMKRFLHLGTEGGVPVEKVVITGKTESKQPFLIDLIEHRLRDSEWVTATKDRVIPYEQRRTALRKIWGKHMQELKKLYGKDVEQS
jgi:hypothetical protein